MTRLITSAIVVVLFASFPIGTNADTYERFTGIVDSSRSAATTVVVQPTTLPETGQAGSRLLVFSRLPESTKAGQATHVLESSLRNGAIRFVLDETLPFRPTVSRVSDSHVAVLSYWGANRSWFKSHPAIEIRALKDGERREFRIEDILERIDDCVFVSRSTISWLKDACFSASGSSLYVALWLKASDRPGVLNRLIRVDVSGGEILHVGESSYREAMRQTTPNFHASLFDIAREENSEVLRDVANEVLGQESTTKHLRAHAAAYLYRVFDDQPAKRVLLGLRTELMNGPPENELELKTIVHHFDDAHAFADNILRESGRRPLN
ncbi:hypothetical protein FYK55_23570 [Roseiconus nitratireducens]|uniref:HEAT repeat domain-containing protein n=1 Tax=Roseiconus nitratireducens TaxID=2605748 RepID=A0A5M6D290_9BACT|nr:hypothetical protein [Roseiconus nitratireducens]KAA5539779.1 hypothetical protein FYK55_23570 [Roseiconus nitratireducens]